MLSRRLLLGLPSRLPGYRRIPAKSTSIAGGQVRPAGADLGTILITSSVLRPTVPWDCCPLEHPFMKLVNSDTMKSMEDLLSYL